jgi:hypothetical protein
MVKGKRKKAFLAGRSNAIIETSGRCDRIYSTLFAVWLPDDIVVVSLSGVITDYGMNDGRVTIVSESCSIDQPFRWACTLYSMVAKVKGRSDISYRAYNAPKIK